MRLIFIIFLFITASVNATTYYVSNSGSDAANGLTTGTSWATLAHAVASIYTGDSVLLNKGDTWNEKFYPTVSSIYLGSYGTGNKPVITGFQSVTMTLSSGNIYTGTVTNSVLLQNTVLINGKLSYKARTPNTSYINNGAALSYTTFKIPHDGNSYVGSELVVREERWVIEFKKITQQKTGVSFDTLVLQTPMAYAAGVDYFYQNKSSYVDTLNEWSQDSATKVITVYSPSAPTVKASVLDTLINLYKVNNIVIDGLEFQGANYIAVSMDSLRYDTVKNCTFKNNGVGVYSIYTKGTAGVQNTCDSTLDNFWVSGTDTATLVRKNTINNSGVFTGMGNNLPEMSTIIPYIGIFVYIGNNAIIDSNTVKKSGYSGIRFTGQYNTVSYNYIDSFCFKKDDGGGIYTVTGVSGALIDTGSVIKNNIIKHGIGAPVSVSDNTSYCGGVYLDDGSSGLNVYENTVDSVLGYPVFIKGASNIFNSNIVRTSSFGFYTTNYFGGTPNNFTIKHNIYYSDNSATFVVLTGSKDSLETIDSNYYMVPLSKTPLFVTGSTYSGLSAWKTATLYDLHSSATLPYGITSYTPTLFINPTLSDSTITLTGGYYDVTGSGYATSFVLHPFESKLLWPGVYEAPTFVNGIKIKAQ